MRGNPLPTITYDRVALISGGNEQMSVRRFKPECDEIIDREILPQ